MGGTIRRCARRHVARVLHLLGPWPGVSLLPVSLFPYGPWLAAPSLPPLPLCSFAQMLWRLNFLVFFACIVLRNSYMLYYICPMHTIFTVMVYAALAIAPHLNTSNAWIWTK